MGRNLADVEYKMRMTQDLKEKIVTSAKAHNRSLNADIIARLEQSFDTTEVSDPVSMKESIDAQRKQINALQEMVQELMAQMRGSK